METLRLFRRAFGNIALGVTVTAALAALMFDKGVAVGILLGGGISSLAFWETARRTELALATPDALKSTVVVRWGCLRFLLYTLSLVAAYRVDPVDWHAIFGAAGGLMVPQCVVLFLGLTGWDQRHKAGD